MDMIERPRCRLLRWQCGAGDCITRERGVVTIEMRPGQSSYAATERNGISSQGYGAHPKSFAVIAR